MIDPDTGKLIIASGGITVVNISDNQSGASPNLTATLEDTGDFQLKDEIDDRILWRSFDYPTNVLLPGMKLGSDLRTGRNWSLTSWLSNEIPDLGAFSLNWEPVGEDSQRLMIRRRGQPYWTSGDLNNQTQTFEFMNVNNPFSLYQYNLSYVYNNEERSFSYHRFNDVRPMWILTADGRVSNGDESMYLSFHDFCYGYDSGNGCVASSNLTQCRNENDKFSVMNGDFTPNEVESSYDDNSNISISDCMVSCWNDCSCLGFITASNGSGCIIWTGPKSTKFTVNPQGNAVQKYVFVAASKGNDSKILIWAPVVAGIFLVLFCCGLVWYLKKIKLKREDEKQLLELMDSSNTKRGGRKGSDLVVFSFADIVTATNDFTEVNKLGQGGFGPVYKVFVSFHMTHVLEHGYMSPEYAMDGTFSVKSDVFSFGVLTLEIVSGRRNMSFSYLDRTVNLIGYAWELWQQGDALHLQDQTLGDSCVVHQLLRTIHVALLCVQENAVDRPEMSVVTSMLGNDTMLLPVPKRPAFFFGRSASNSTLVEEKTDGGSVNNITITQMEAR
ncbi:hypothetical protein R6Q59_015520 [Mikania micrantha]